MNVTGIHHLTLTVLDAEASAEWYQRLLGPAEVIRRVGRRMDPRAHAVAERCRHRRDPA